MKKFDVIIWGASGFTGRLVAEYLLGKYGCGDDLNWAMAGRNQAKLEAIAAELGNADIPLLIADSQDEASLEAMVQQSKVVCSTVGPFAKYGSKLVAACVKHQTHYCDITGEAQWIRKMIDQHQDAAAQSGTKIVHCCGFDSIPSDMGVFFLQNEAKKQKGAYCQQIKFRVKGAKGGGSGGTYASMLNIMEEVRKDKSIYKILNNPYGLNPELENQGNDVKDLQSVVFDSDTGTWISPFVMAGINTKIVRRSHALAGFPYGKSFRYDEAMIAGKGLTARAKAWVGLIGLGIALSAKKGSFIYKMMLKRIPKPGEGPSKEVREAGFFNILLVGKMQDGSLFKGKVTGDKDPGYGSTCKMLGESAVCLAKDELPSTAGILTPATGMGQVLLDRLVKNAGLSFEVLD